jgi:glycerophosphoryl diester phosphodiesterase
VALVQVLDDEAVAFDAAGVRVVGVEIARFGDPRGTVPPEDFTDIARYANAIGPWKRQILREVQSPTLLETTLIEQAHAAGLRVHPYTFRNELGTLAPQYASDPRLEYLQFFELGVDGVFSDFPDTALAARQERAR